MKRHSFLVVILFLVSSLTIAQTKLFTVEEIFGSRGKFSVNNLRQLNWVPDTDQYVWVDGQGENAALLGEFAKKNIVDTLLTLKSLNTILSTSGFTALKNFPMMNWVSSTEFLYWNGAEYFKLNTKFKKAEAINKIPDYAEEREIAPNNKSIAYTVANNLFVSLEHNKQIQISFDKDSNVVNGQSVHRNEFGINGGIFWSPKSSYIAYYRMDQTMVTDYPLVDMNYTPAKVKNTKYPMTGQPSHHVTVGIYSIATGKTIWLKTGEPLEQYLTCITWSPDEKHLYIAHLNRDQNHMQLKKYDVSTGEFVKQLFEEKDNEYVEAQNQLIFLPNDETKFLWFSQRDGFNHLYLYDVEGNLIKQVTQGKWLITNFNGFDKSSKYIFITSTKESPIERHYYRVSLETGKMDKLTKDSGTHNVFANSSFTYFIDSYSNITTPRVINLVDQKGGIIKNLLLGNNPIKDYKIGSTKIFTIKNDVGIDLYCRLVLPADFDSTKKYPVIVYVYGGPHAQEVNNVFGVGGYSLWAHMMTQKGYIVFTLDNRGSANRGLDFEQATFRRLGTFEVADQLSGVNYLKTLPYIDGNRFGVFGWSYGGFMATSLMLRTNNAFKVGVGGGSVIDWKFYEVMYGERYMDTPQSNPEGYKEASLLNYADKLNGKLLLVHGTMDPTVVIQNSFALAKKAQELNKPLDYFPYIGHGHGVGGKDAIHLYNKITSYFLNNL